MTDLAVPDCILVSRGPGETRYALMAGDELVEVAHLRDGALHPGVTLFARIGAAVPHMQAVFVDIGAADAAVLKIKPPLPSEGTGVAVTVTVPPRAGKGAEVKLNADVPVPADGRAGQVLQAAPDPAAAWWKDHAATIPQILCCGRPEAQRLKALLDANAPVEVCTGADLFAAKGVDEAIEAALEPAVALPCGGSLVIEATAAVIAIDVNAGPADIDTANREALVAAARELRRRNLAGHMIIDIIPTKKRISLLRAFTSQAAADPDIRVAGLTPLGMIELTRRRVGLSLAETLCGADGRLSAASVALSALRAAVRFGFTAQVPHVGVAVSAEVAEALKGPLAPALAEAQSALKGDIRITARADVQRARFDLSPA